MSVNIWEGSKAQALIDAILNTQKIDKQQGMENAGKVLTVGSDGIVVPSDSMLSSDIANALLACFRNVAWASANGQDFYDALEAAISGTPVPAYDHVVSYLASSGTVLSAATGFEVVDGNTGTMAETISNNILNVQLPAGTNKTSYLMIRLANYVPANATKALMKCKYRINSLPEITLNSYSPMGVSLTMKAGSACAGIYTHRNTSHENYFLVYNSSNNQSDTSKQFTLGQWYEVELMIENGTQTIKVDNDTIYSGAGNTKFNSSGIIFSKLSDSSSTVNMDIDYLKVYWS